MFYIKFRKGIFTFLYKSKKRVFYFNIYIIKKIKL